MSTESNEIAGVSEARRLYWSLRRELWESRSIYLAPVSVAGVVLLGFSISAFHLRARLEAASTLDAARQHQLIAHPYQIASLLIMFTTFVVGVFYCLDALHGERGDRSILFWKSLPVSDLTTVLSKASIPLVVLPLVTFTITLATHLLMLLLNTLVVLGSDLSVATLWTRLSLFHTSVVLLYHLVTVHSLWYAPFYGWLLLVSAWARRAPFLWASLPLLAIGMVEKIAFNTSHFATLLGRRIAGGAEAVMVRGSFPMDTTTQLIPVHFLTSAGLWVGLVLAALFLAAAVRLRRDHGPI